MSLKLERNRATLEKYNSIQPLRIVSNETKRENEESVDRTIENAVREQKVKMPRRQQKRLRKIVKMNYNYRDVDLSDGGVSDSWSNPPLLDISGFALELHTPHWTWSKQQSWNMTSATLIPNVQRAKHRCLLGGWIRSDDH